MTEPVIDRGRNAAFTAIGQAFVLVGATAIGLVVAARLGTSARVDAYFAANQVFAAILFVGQGIRTAVPGLELSGHATAPTIRRAVGWIAAAGTGLLVLAALVGPLLLPAGTRTGFTRDLLLLAPGGALQIVGGYLAARLAMHQRFAGAALAYAGGTAVNAVVLLGLVGRGGASILAPAALAGTVSAVLALVMLAWQARALRRPAISASQEAQAAGTAGLVDAPALGVRASMGRILLSVTPVLVPQLMITSAVIAAATVQSGGSTLLTYAFLALNAVSTVAIAPIPIVLSADLGVSWDRQADSLRPQVLAVVRVAVAVTVPAAAGLFLVGRPVADALLGALTPADVTKILELVAILMPSLILTSASMVALVAIVTLDRLALLARRLLLCGAGAAATIAATVPLGFSLTGLITLVAFWATAVAVATLTVVFGRATPQLCLAAVRAACRVGVPGIVALAGAWLLGGNLALGVLLTVVVGCVHVVWVRTTERVVFDRLVGAIAPR